MVVAAEIPVHQRRTIGPQPGPQTLFLSTSADIAIFGGAAGGGKGLALDTYIPTPSGWTTMEHLTPGDEVFGADGKPCKVTAVSEINYRKCYLLGFDDGAQIITDDVHRWLTFDERELAQLTRLSDEFRRRRQEKRESKVSGNKSTKFTESLIARNKARAGAKVSSPEGTVRNTEQIAQTLFRHDGGSNHAVRVCQPLTLEEAFLVLDPYVLGLWLGDGYTDSPRIGMALEDFYEVLSHIEASKVLKTRLVKEERKTPFLEVKLSSLSEAFKAYGLKGHKFIPPIYLRASFNQRLSLLQGLMDTDGTCGEDGNCAFEITDEEIANNFAELLSSLGIKFGFSIDDAKLYGRVISARYRFRFTTTLPAFRLKRKLSRQNLTVRRTTQFRYITSCEEIETVPTKCITVDSPDHLYLATQWMIPTHNSYALLMEPLRHVHNPKFRAVIFRRTSVQVRNEGGLWDESLGIYPDAGGKPKEHDLYWAFKSGASIGFAHLEYEKNVHDWQGSQIPFIGFDELTHFTERQFWYLLSRNRSSSGIKPYVRATCNPDCDSWVAKFIDWWINPDTGYAIPERSGKLRWMVRIGEKIVWADSPEDLSGFKDPITGKSIPPKSVTFIHSHLSDNKIFVEADPSYSANLMALPQVERERLLNGNWKIRQSGNLFFDIENLLENRKPVSMPFSCDGIFAVADTASKTGKEHDGTGVTFFARSRWYGIPLVVVDWDLLQIAGASLPSYLPSILRRGEELARECKARNGFVGVWIEDRQSGTILLQHGKANQLPVRPIDTKLTAVGKDERAFAISGHVGLGKIKIAEHAYHKVVDYKGVSRNHFMSQIENFAIADKDAGKREDDLLDTFCYGVSIALGNSKGF